MRGWRPKNWDNPYEPVWGNPFRGEFHVAYEAGADAMLKAIWKLAEESPTKTFTFLLVKLTMPPHQDSMDFIGSSVVIAIRNRT